PSADPTEARNPRLGSRRPAPRSRAGGVGSDDPVAETNLSVVEDVGAEAAAVDELPKDRARCVRLNDSARLAEPRAATTDVSDREFASDEGVEVDPADDEISAVSVRREGGVERFADPGFDERQGTTGKTGGETARALDVAISREADAGQRLHGLGLRQRLAGGCGYRNRLDGSAADSSCRPVWERERDVGRGDDEAVGDGVGGDRAVARGIPDDSGGNAVHDDVPRLGRPRLDAGDPGPRPGERIGLADTSDAEAETPEPTRKRPERGWILAAIQLRQLLGG